MEDVCLSKCFLICRCKIKTYHKPYVIPFQQYVPNAFWGTSDLKEIVFRYTCLHFCGIRSLVRNASMPLDMVINSSSTLTASAPFSFSASCSAGSGLDFLTCPLLLSLPLLWLCKAYSKMIKRSIGISWNVHKVMSKEYNYIQNGR